MPPGISGSDIIGHARPADARAATYCHEVIHRGRPACDYIRGWLHYCLEAYLRLGYR